MDYGATADELEIHFNGCGPVNRVTILCDRFSGHPKGWVYPLPSHHLPLPSSTLTTSVLVAHLSLPGTPVWYCKWHAHVKRSYQCYSTRPSVSSSVLFFRRHSFAYIEFSDRDSVQSAIGLDETLFRGRVLKVGGVYFGQ